MVPNPDRYIIHILVSLERKNNCFEFLKDLKKWLMVLMVKKAKNLNFVSVWFKFYYLSRYMGYTVITKDETVKTT